MNLNLLRLFVVTFIIVVVTGCAGVNTQNPSFCGYDGDISVFEGKIKIEPDKNDKRFSMTISVDFEDFGTGQKTNKISNLSFSMHDSKDEIVIGYDNPKNFLGEKLATVYIDKRTNLMRVESGGKIIEENISDEGISEEMKKLKMFYSGRNEFFCGQTYLLEEVSIFREGMDDDNIEVISEKSDGNSTVLGLIKKGNRTYLLDGHKYSSKIKAKTKTEGHIFYVKTVMSGYTAKATDGSGNAFVKMSANVFLDNKKMFYVNYNMDLLAL